MGSPKPIPRCIIAGGRDLIYEGWMWTAFLALHKRRPVLEIVSGKAGGYTETGIPYGGDVIGEWFAKELGVPVAEFPADWTRYGNGAGPIRNGEMADYASRVEGSAVIALPGGPGTANMLKQARWAGLEVFDWRRGPGAVIALP